MTKRIKLNILQRIFYPPRLKKIIYQLDEENDLNIRALLSINLNFLIYIIPFSIIPISYALEKMSFFNFILLGSTFLILIIIGLYINFYYHIIPTAYPCVLGYITKVEEISSSRLGPNANFGYKIQYSYQDYDGNVHTGSTTGYALKDIQKTSGNKIKVYFDPINPTRSLATLKNKEAKHVLRKSNIERMI